MSTVQAHDSHVSAAQITSLLSKGGLDEMDIFHLKRCFRDIVPHVKFPTNSEIAAAAAQRSCRFVTGKSALGKHFCFVDPSDLIPYITRWAQA